VSFAVRIGKALDKYLWDRMRDKRASEVTSGVPGTFEALKGRKYALIVTFKRSGEAVPTASWFGLGDEGNLYTHTFADSWKVKRISRDPRALVAPSDLRGKPLGPAIEGRARVLPRAEWERAERAIAANYGLGRKLYMAPARGRQDAMTYLEIVPAGA
jgi:PPOX class probable F420-dependent enzyme